MPETLTEHLARQMCRKGVLRSNPHFSAADVERAVDVLWGDYEGDAREAIACVRDWVGRDSSSALLVAMNQPLRKEHGERDTEFVKRITIGFIDEAFDQASENA